MNAVICSQPRQLALSLRLLGRLFGDPAKPREVPRYLRGTDGLLSSLADGAGGAKPFTATEEGALGYGVLRSRTHSQPLTKTGPCKAPATIRLGGSTLDDL